MLDPEIYKIITHDQYGGYKNQQIKPNKHSHHHHTNNIGNSKQKNHIKNHNTNGIDSDDNGNVDLKKYTVVYVGDGRSRVRRVVRSHTRHVTVVSYSPRSKETSSHTSHHVTTVSFPQKVNDRSSNAYSSHHSAGTGSIGSSGAGNGGYVYLQQQQHYAPSQQQLVYHHHHQIPQYHNHGGHQNMATPTLHKKGSIRGGSDVLKRTRGQNAYELSQDLLDKQIELLERKYGGVKARHAALTIQRAFRHYVMVKKFASITAMAKAEKRLSRRMPAGQGSQDLGGSPYLVDEHGQTVTSTYSAVDHENSAGQRVCATISATPAGQRVTPVRSMSLRERRNLDSSPIPRSQSGNTTQQPPVSCWTQSPIQQNNQHSHPYVNILHQHQQHYMNSSPAAAAALIHQHQHSHYQAQPQLQYQSQYSSQELNMSACSQLDTSHPSMMNSSWNSHHQSPHMPHYSASQIYMRPRGGTQGSSGSCGSAGSGSGRKVPPEVPKRTSSITPCNTPPNRAIRPNGLCKSAENGSLSSVQSSGSDSSASVERMQCELGSDRSSSPQWKRKASGGIQITAQSPDHHMGTSVCGAESECMSSHTSAAQYSIEHEQLHTPTSYKVSETIRKRQYRVGLNLFNKKPEKGIAYLIRRGFLENTPHGVARFLISRKGLSRQMIGEYLGNLQSQFNMAVLECFAGELDLSGMQVDVALRKFQGYFRMPGEAQKIERLMEIFSQRYSQCNTDIVGRLRSTDTVFVLAFAIIMLNTDLHTPNLKPERRMRCDDFIKNLRGIDDCHDIDRDMLAGIYERLKTNEFKPGSDHVTQVMKVQATIVGKKPNLALPHRRLVCYCRLYEIPDINKKERPGVHQREVFLFNDLLVITKIFSKKKSSVTYTFRNSYPLCGMVVTLLDVPNYPYCIRLSQKVDNKVLVTFNARNEHDRCKFAEDLRESISEMDEMETLRIEAELDRQKSTRGGNRNNNNNNGSSGGGSENRDSGVADVEVCPGGAGPYQATSPGGTSGCGGDPHNEQQLKRSALSNSLLDMHEQFGNEKPQRRGSVGSLDSGMSISFQSTSASTGSRSDSKVRMIPHTGAPPSGPMYIPANHQPQMVVYSGAPPTATGAMIQQQTRRERKMSRSDDAVAAAAGNAGAYARSTEV